MRYQQRQRSTDWGKRDVHQNQAGPLERLKHRKQNDCDQHDRERHNERQALIGALLAFIFAGPLKVISLWQWNQPVYSGNRLFNRTSQIAITNAVFHSYVPLLSFAINLFRPIRRSNCGQLRQRHSFACGRKQSHILDRFLCVSIWLLIAQDKVILSLSLKNLAESCPSHCRLNCILNICDVDAKSRRCQTINGKVQIGLSNDSE